LDCGRRLLELLVQILAGRRPIMIETRRRKDAELSKRAAANESLGLGASLR